MPAAGTCPKQRHGGAITAPLPDPARVADPMARDSIAKALKYQTLTTPSGRKVEFPIDAFSKHCLVEGVDELGYILQHEAQIAAYEARRVGSIDTLG